MLEILKEWVKNEMEEVLRAKTAFIVTLIIASCIAYLAASWRYNGIIESKEAIIVKLKTILEYNNVGGKIESPFLIFDANNVIHNDYGANELLESIEVKQVAPPLQKYKIIVTPKKVLSSAPLLESIDSYKFSIKSNRGKGIQWEYELDVGSCLDCEKVPMFRLEILK
ncbi:MAG: hypothetical protein ACOY4W_06120 [Thermodesulfobacteriota bacterium]